MKKNTDSPLHKTHTQMGDSALGAWVPKDWELEARALLYAARKVSAPFGRMPSFNNGTLNPFFGMPAETLSHLAMSQDAKAPWFCYDAPVQAALTGLTPGGGDKEALPVIVIKCVNPMEHVALVTLLSSLEGWKFTVEIRDTTFEGAVYSKTGRAKFSFESSIEDEDTRLILNYLKTRTEEPAGVLALPTDYSFFTEIEGGKSLQAGVLLLDKCLAFSFTNKSHLSKRISGKQTRLETISRKSLAEMKA